MKALTTIPAALAVLGLLGACAPKPENVSASYVSRTEYSNLTCAQLNDEARALSDELADVTGQQRSAATTDAAVTAVTLVLFWPAVFFIGHGDKSDQLANLKGRAQALESAGRAAGCGQKGL